MYIPIYTFVALVLFQQLLNFVLNKSYKEKKSIPRFLFFIGILIYVYLGHKASKGDFDAQFVAPHILIEFPGLWISKTGTNQIIFILLAIYLIITGFNWLKKSGKF